MAITASELKTAYNGYHRSFPAEEDAELTHSDPGTPCGEYLRRFWQPVCMSEQLTDLPLALRIMGEDLVAFRDLSGNVGLLHRQCSHRRTSLEYGIISEHGIRCCYHGWLFDVDGTILETPGEPDDSPIKDSLHHGAYPALEYKGLVFAYMGPPEKKPEFPIYDTFEIADTEMVPYAIDMPCNWLQVNENPQDPFHAVFLHTRATRAQFSPSWGATGLLEWHRTPDGTRVYLTNTRRWGEFIWVRVAETVAPNFAQPTNIYEDASQEKWFTRAGISKWVVPIDDTNCKLIAWRHFNDMVGNDPDYDKIGLNKVDFIGQTGVERTMEEGRREPGDFEAQVGQGPITIHKLERLGTTDTGVAMLRAMLRRGIRRVKKGEMPRMPALNADGRVPTISGDIVLSIPELDESDINQRQEIGQKAGQIVFDTLLLPYEERQSEITRRLKELRDTD